MIMKSRCFFLGSEKRTPKQGNSYTLVYLQEKPGTQPTNHMAKMDNFPADLVAYKECDVTFGLTSYQGQQRIDVIDIKKVV